MFAYQTGAVVAIAWLSLCVSGQEAIYQHKSGRSVQPLNCDVSWSEIVAHKYAEGPVCWVLEAITKLSKPIPCKGAQGLWVLPVEIETLIWQDLGTGLPDKLKGICDVQKKDNTV